ncbi:hypothetical protein SAMN06265784_10613 [Paraburkholderia susongensis]|uniref:Uncharacterized protein n=1 Tax=Paraburkholderia susongensis TaxID=1515439 RepID=A0A1X7LH54_9BURK|nr:hypothetical protein SAMN06265784_10613 [Paraburkholderia susongensis]
MLGPHEFATLMLVKAAPDQMWSGMHATYRLLDRNPYALHLRDGSPEHDAIHCVLSIDQEDGAL